jgi:hypothetical protein
MRRTTSPTPDLSGALGTAACLITTAALVHATGAAPVRVVVSGADIDIQIPPPGGDQPAREATVAAYAQILGAPVTRQRSRVGDQAWTETHGVLGGHDIHVWTVTDPLQEA